MSSSKKSSNVTKSNAVVAEKAKALLAQASTLLAAGEPLTAKARKEVVIRSIRTTPALVTAAAATYTQHATVLGGDLDPKGALDAQDYVVELTPVVTELRTFAQALEDRIHEHQASASEFAQTVYDRAQAMQRMPQGSVLAPRITQLEELSVRPKRRAKGKKEVEPAVEETEPASNASSSAPAAATPPATPPTVVVNAAKQ